MLKNAINPSRAGYKIYTLGKQIVGEFATPNNKPFII
jgi:hypothetical protein